MASVLASVVKKVCEIAVDQAVNEVSIVYNFRAEFELLKDRIEVINCVLNEADEESTEQRKSVKKWLHRARDIEWEAEDILEECDVDSLYATNSQSWTLGCGQLIRRDKMGRRIQEVKAQLSSVVAEGNQLNIVRAAVAHREAAAESSSTSHAQRFKKTSVLPSDSKPVGIHYKIESIVSLLENPQIPMIAVVGMGGVGKTYLLQHVYNSQKGRYEKSAWLSVSQFYSVSKLQRDLAFQLDEGLCKKIRESGISEMLAAELINGFMLEKRCLVVLDDVWRAAREGDLPTKLGIPIGGNSQCKILVSTRSREVCVNLNAEIYEMECLTDEDSWRLFCAHAFPKSEGNRVPEKLEVARNIVEECGNLPLSIKTTAASLASTVALSEWQSKLSKLKKVSTSDDHVMDVLKLSYDSLPAHLKACFAYFSFFPEDEQIECDYLMYLWMAEGFFPTGENPSDCLEQLANLCLLEVWEDSAFVFAGVVLANDNRLHKYCKIHDLLLDLAILISRENKCAFSLEDAFSKLHSVNTGGVRWCRLFLAKKDIDEHAISKRHPVFPTLIRTLSLSWNTQIGRNIPAMLFNGMRLLRVLDLSHTNISTLLASVGGMKLLKVLNLRSTKTRKVLKCVRSLKSLCYLNVSGCRVSKAPKWIGDLRCLKHLEGQFWQLPKGISKLESLRTLRTFPLSLSKNTCMQCGVLRLEDVGEMSELQEIHFEVSDESQLKRMEEGILAPLNMKMRRLEVKNDTIGMQGGESESDLPQFPEMKAMRSLEHLTLWKFAVPSWICCLTNLRYLELDHCHCSDYPELQEMPSLVSLPLCGNWKRCRELPKAFGKSGGFPHLRFFTIHGLSELEEFPEMEDGAMPCLEKLEISSCYMLNKVGEGLERLKSLRELSLDFGTRELRAMFREGEEYWKEVKDINPQITITILEY